MSTVLHTPNESDTALSLYEGDIYSDFYQRNGYYGKSDFFELAKRLGVLKMRSEKILLEFIHKKQEVIALIQNSFLTNAEKEKYIAHYINKMKRFD
jgi:serine/threonine-protein kinase HipA